MNEPKVRYKKVDSFFNDNDLIKNQIEKSQEILKDFKTNRSSEIAVSILTNSF